MACHRQAHRLESAGDLRLPELIPCLETTRRSDPTLLDPDAASHVVTVRRRSLLTPYRSLRIRRQAGIRIDAKRQALYFAEQSGARQ